VCDFPGLVAKDVAQNLDRALAGRQELERGDECQRDCFSSLILRLRPGRRIGESFQESIGIRLDPRHLARSGRLGQVQLSQVRLGPGTPPGEPQHVQAAGGGDAVQPCANGRTALERAQALPCCQQRLLERVLRVGKRAKNAVAMDLQLAPVRIDEPAEGVFVPTEGSLDQVRRHRSSPRPL
jgi:hypothetical protein